MKEGEKDTSKEMDASRDAMNQAYEELKQAKQHFQRAAEAAGLEAKEEAIGQWLKGKRKADAMGSEVENYVNEKPFSSLGIAFVVGLLVSQLFSNR